MIFLPRLKQPGTLMDDLKTLFTKEPERLAQIQDFILTQVGTRIFPPKGPTESEETYNNRRKNEEAVLLEMINSENMKTWIKVFVHISSDLEVNYDSLEAIGDKLLGYIVLEYVRTKFNQEFGRDMTAEEFTNAGKNLNNNEFFGSLADEIGLPKLLITYYKITPKVKGDMFEALVGALSEVGDRIGTKYRIPRLGIQLAKNFIITFYKRLDLKAKYDDFFSTDPKTAVDQIFKQLKWTTQSGSSKPVKTVRTVLEKVDGRTVPVIIVTVGLTTEASEWFKKQGRSVAPGYVIGKGQDYTKKGAERDAYKMALRTLRKINLTDTEVERYKNLLRNEETAEYFKTKTTERDFPRNLLETFEVKVKPYQPYRFEYTQLMNEKYAALIGTNPSTGKSIYLARIHFPVDVRYADERLTNLYLIDKFVNGRDPILS